jgi:hypothetical protein
MSTFYDSSIKPHLTAAHEYAYRAAREISRMPQRPAFFTLAQDELDKAETEASRILEVIRSAKAEFAAKPLEKVA